MGLSLVGMGLGLDLGQVQVAETLTAPLTPPAIHTLSRSAATNHNPYSSHIPHNLKPYSTPTHICFRLLDRCHDTSILNHWCEKGMSWLD